MKAWYRPVTDEVEVFERAFQSKLPVLLKGPTGCGKSRFVEFMAQRLNRPLVTVACNDETSAADLVGRWLVRGGDTVWQDGPATRALKTGALLYLDEVAEAREDVVVLLHPLTDHRRQLYLDRNDEVLSAPSEFMVVASFNPGYRRGLKELKPSTRQRFVSLEFGYPEPGLEATIIAHESGVEPAWAERLAAIGHKVRSLREQGLDEGVSTRLLIYAGQLMVRGIDARRACAVAIAQGLGDDPEVQQAVTQVIDVLMP